MAARVISVDSHVHISHEAVKERLAADIHDDVRRCRRVP